MGDRQIRRAQGRTGRQIVGRDQDRLGIARGGPEGDGAGQSRQHQE